MDVNSLRSLDQVLTVGTACPLFVNNSGIEFDDLSDKGV